MSFCFLPTLSSYICLMATFVYRAWLNPIREIQQIDCDQIPHDVPVAPLLPPDIVFRSTDISVEGTPRTTRYRNAEIARKEYNKLSLCPLSKRRHRKFVYGALYEKIYPGCYEVDPLAGDYDLIVNLPSKEQASIHVRLVAPDETGSPTHLSRAAIELGQALPRPGNSRGAKVGDIGAMHALGFKSAKSRETFKCSKKVSEKVKKVSTFMRHWMEDNMKEVLMNILKVDKDLGVSKILPCMPAMALHNPQNLSSSKRQTVAGATTAA